MKLYLSYALTLCKALTKQPYLVAKASEAATSDAVKCATALWASAQSDWVQVLAV